MNNELKIIGLKADGIRKLTAVNMQFSENGLIIVAGENEQGKSTLLDFLMAVFRGDKYITAGMVQNGKKEGGGTIELSNGYVITKKIKKNGSTMLEVKRPDNTLENSPQTFLKNLINDLTFDPLPFLNKKKDEKLKFLMDLLKIDFTEIDNRITKHEQDRLLTGREVKAFGGLEAKEKVEFVSMEALLKTKNKIEADNKVSQTEYDTKCNDAKLKIERDNSELKLKYEQICNAEKSKIIEFNNEQKQVQEKLDSIINARQKLSENIKDIEEQIKQLQLKLKDKQETLIAADKQIKEIDKPEVLKELKINIPEPKYLSAETIISEIPKPVIQGTSLIDESIKTAAANNTKAQEYMDYLGKKEAKENKQQEYDNLTAEIKGLRDEKKFILSETKMPVNGLEIKENELYELGLYFNNIESDNWSKSQGYKISMQLCLAMQPKLKALFLDDGESFDPKRQKELQQIAIDNDIQIIITVVSEIPETLKDGVFYIEEGHVYSKDNALNLQ